MPYTVRRKGARTYEVVNSDTGEVKARSTSKAKAERQVRVLRGVERGWEPTGEPDTYHRTINGRQVKLHLSGGKKGGTK